MTQEEKKAYMLKWRRDNPEKVLAAKRRRLDKIKNSPELLAEEKRRQAEGYQKHKSKRQAWAKKYNAENAESRKRYYAEHHSKNAEHKRALAKAYYYKNRERCLVRAKAYAQRNITKILAYHKTRPIPPHVKNAYVSVYRARKRGNANAGADMGKIMAYYEVASRVSKCTGIRFSVDHVVPISRGGPHHQSNLQVLPLRVNIRKAASLPT